MPALSEHWSHDPRKVRLLDWLTTPPHERNPRTQALLADALGCSPRTMRMWMQNPEFREEWDRQAKFIVGTPERAQAVLDTLYNAAIDSDNRNHVQAAKLYLEATHAIAPPPVEVRVTRPSDLSDTELDQLLALGAAELRASRSGDVDVDATDGVRVVDPDETYVE